MINEALDACWYSYYQVWGSNIRVYGTQNDPPLEYECLILPQYNDIDITMSIGEHNVTRIQAIVRGRTANLPGAKYARLGIDNYDFLYSITAWENVQPNYFVATLIRVEGDLAV